MLAHVQPVVGAEHDVGVAREALGPEHRFDAPDRAVDCLHGLGAPAEVTVELRDLPALQRHEVAQP